MALLRTVAHFARFVRRRMVLRNRFVRVRLWAGMLAAGVIVACGHRDGVPVQVLCHASNVLVLVSRAADCGGSHRPYGELVVWQTTRFVQYITWPPLVAMTWLTCVWPQAVSQAPKWRTTLVQ